MRAHLCGPFAVPISHAASGYVDLRVARGFDFCSLIDSLYRAIALNLGAPSGEGV
jgi:hypothetical protein